MKGPAIDVEMVTKMQEVLDGPDELVARYVPHGCKDNVTEPVVHDGPNVGVPSQRGGSRGVGARGGQLGGVGAESRARRLLVLPRFVLRRDAAPARCADPGGRLWGGP